MFPECNMSTNCFNHGYIHSGLDTLPHAEREPISVPNLTMCTLFRPFLPSERKTPSYAPNEVFNFQLFSTGIKKGGYKNSAAYKP